LVAGVPAEVPVERVAGDLGADPVGAGVAAVVDELPLPVGVGTRSSSIGRPCGAAAA
jgi:hypothetical protein